jgi:hypothetical protein
MPVLGAKGTDTSSDVWDDFTDGGILAGDGRTGNSCLRIDRHDRKRLADSIFRLQFVSL